VPFKFLDIGTKMGEYHLEDFVLRRDDYNRSGIPPADTFQSVMRGRVGDRADIIQLWCSEKAWFDHSPTHDFWVVDESKYRWGLPVLVPTCPRKLFAQGPRLKYVDIVTDTQHASSSDLITWNTLVMMKLRWLNEIPRKWVDITVNSLEAWNARDQLSQFHADTRRGYARVTPIAFSHVGVPDSCTLPVDEFPKEGLGVYDDYETCDKFSGYIWATCTTMVAQPMQIDSALQALLNPSAQASSSQSAVNYDLGTPVNVNHADQPMGSNECASAATVPFPDSVEDVSMDPGVDKRSRESPDSTLKPEGKSLKTSENATTPVSKDAEEMLTADDAKSSNVTKRPRTVSEAKSLMQEVHLRMPAWKADKLLEARKTEQVDLEALGEATGILFESQDVFNEAVMHLENLRKEKDGKDDVDSDASDTQSSQSKNRIRVRISGPATRRMRRQPPHLLELLSQALVQQVAVVALAIEILNHPRQQQVLPVDSKMPNASNIGSATKEKTDSVTESHEDWFNRVTKMGQDVSWPPMWLR